MYNSEHIEYISDRLRLIVSPQHTFGTDALLLAAFSHPAPNAKCVDFGTGCGIIPFYWLREGVKKVQAVEIQPLACDQVRRSIELNNLQNDFILTEGDLTRLKGTLPTEYFDVITMNPPYTPLGGGIISETSADRIARHETCLTLPSLCTAAAKHLKFGGAFCVCLRPERLSEMMYAMHDAKIEPKRLRFVSQRPGKAPWLFLLEGKKGRKPGLTVEKTLYIESEEMEKIVGEYKKN